MLFQHTFSKVILSVTVEDNDETILQTDKNCHFPHTCFQTRPLGPGGGGTQHTKGVGMLVGNWIKPLKETDVGEDQTFFDP